MQVGIGNGNAKINGDYNFWFLPQHEDLLDVVKGGKPGPAAYYVKYRPVFEAAAPGQKVSPDLAGRYAADFALGAQLLAGAPRGTSCRWPGRSTRREDHERGQDRDRLPQRLLPGHRVEATMLWGAAEIALADERLGVPQAQLRRHLAVAAVGAGVHRAGPPGRRRHAEPVR